MSCEIHHLSLTLMRMISVVFSAVARWRRRRRTSIRMMIVTTTVVVVVVIIIVIIRTLIRKIDDRWNIDVVGW